VPFARGHRHSVASDEKIRKTDDGIKKFIKIDYVKKLIHFFTRVELVYCDFKNSRKKFWEGLVEQLL